jgi:hypothetical protein
MLLHAKRGLILLHEYRHCPGIQRGRGGGGLQSHWAYQDTLNCLAVCNNNLNNYVGTNRPKCFTGPSLYYTDTVNKDGRKNSIVNCMGQGMPGTNPTIMAFSCMPICFTGRSAFRAFNATDEDNKRRRRSVGLVRPQPALPPDPD